MLQVPEHVLKKLHCAKCGGYLSCAPVVITQQNEQVCGRCFKILPQEDRKKGVRQIGLEAVAELLIFPCKYHLQGCTYTFPWNNGCEHEITCQHRNNSLPFPSNTSENSYTSYQSKEIEVKVLCDHTYNSFPDEDKLKLNLDIAGKDGHKLYLLNLNQKDHIKLNLEVVVSLDAVPKVTYTHVFVDKQEEEPIYDTVTYVLQNVKCTNCHKNILTTEIFHCPFGHTLCKNCKKNICDICGALSNSGSQHYCKNYVKGCTDLFPTTDISKHEIDCEFNDFKCPLCNFTQILNNVIVHFVQNHEVVLSNELTVKLTKKDQNWYFFYQNKLFRCMYLNFYDSVDFIVMYVGCNDNARNYKCEISLTVDNAESTKCAKCLGWNEVSLGQAVSFEVANKLRKSIQVRIIIF